MQQAVLEERHFLLPEPRIMATLSKPTLVDYGGIFMLLRDEGRSGYFFLRIQPAESSSTLLEGLMDNNLFNDHSGHFTAGQLQKMPCMRR